MDAVLAIEEVAAVCPRSGDVVQTGNFGALRTLAEFGTPAQKERWLQPLLKGEGLICVAMTEPNAGSNAANQQTTAVLDGDHWVLNGAKIFITNAGPADVFITYAATDRALGSKGISAFGILEAG